MNPLPVTQIASVVALALALSVAVE
ncbi:MAG: hypothetical protein JWO91_2180, partial [Acidobacteriaceae bacterium]|nr:hypothetical protein [Acidobacteriaceae bacterium]